MAWEEREQKHAQPHNEKASREVWRPTDDDSNIPVHGILMWDEKARRSRDVDVSQLQQTRGQHGSQEDPEHIGAKVCGQRLNAPSDPGVPFLRPVGEGTGGVKPGVFGVLDVRPGPPQLQCESSLFLRDCHPQDSCKMLLAPGRLKERRKEIELRLTNPTTSTTRSREPQRGAGGTENGGVLTSP